MNFKELAQTYNELESSSKRLRKTRIISNLLHNTSVDDLEMILFLLRGQVYADKDKDLGVASRLVLKALSISSGVSVLEIEKLWRDKGDLGLVASELVSRKSQSQLFFQDLSVKDVFLGLRKLSSMEGHGSVDSKVKVIAGLLSNASSVEATYIVRIVLQDLRVGVAEGTLRDAIAWAFLDEAEPNYDESNDSINPLDRQAYSSVLDLLQSSIDKTNDFFVASVTAKQGLDALKNVKMIIDKPVKVMLAQKAVSASNSLEMVGIPCFVEYKYDGFRMQIHKNKDSIKIFTRRLDDVTLQFPEVKDYVLDNIKVDSCIIDCEAVGYNAGTGKYTSFQNISQRIKRKYNIHELSKSLPVELVVFDLLFLDGEEMIDMFFSDRVSVLKRIVNEVPFKIVLAKQLVVNSADEAQSFFDESIKLGNEGLMFKSFSGTYKPGARVGCMVKLKSSMDELDLVIVGAEWGEGKRSSWMTSFSLACFSNGDFLEVGKVGTGLKEKREEGLSFDELTELLKPLVISEKGKQVIVKPGVVVSIKYDEIQKSPSYSSGFALRFPRVASLREDRDVEDIACLDDVEHLYYEQKKV